MLMLTAGAAQLPVLLLINQAGMLAGSAAAARPHAQQQLQQLAALACLLTCECPILTSVVYECRHLTPVNTCTCAAKQALLREPNSYIHCKLLGRNNQLTPVNDCV
jgi:hypothetical protein